MRLLQLVLVLALIVACHQQGWASDPEQTGPLKRLFPYLGWGGLERLPPEKNKQLFKDLAEIFPKRSYGDSLSDYKPMYVWDFQMDDGPPLYVLFEMRDTSHPGCSKIRITQIGTTKVLAEQEFDTAYRTYCTGVATTWTRRDEPRMICLCTDSGGGGGSFAFRQYYGKIGDRFELIRVENAVGEIKRNSYERKGQGDGPPIPIRSAEEWESDVTSTDRLKTLRALVWLGGVHWDLMSDLYSGPTQELRELVLLAREVRQRPKVVARLRELSESKDRWLREAALLALQPKEE